jgi:LmbE family N-acetylglucosaminyl deacetylase
MPADSLVALAGVGSVPGSVAVVVAHPDDETIGIGGQLARIPDVIIAHVTDGAPRDLKDAHAQGFDDAASYAAARRREAAAALALAELPAASAISFEIPDQSAALQMPMLVRRLAHLFTERAIRTVVTHAFEGGHPDHDATAFAVHAAATLSSCPLMILEMPFYREGPEGWIIQQFRADPDWPELTLWLTERERRLKERMLAAYRTQAATLQRFSAEVERFRMAPRYEFTCPPQPLLYEREGWGMTGSRWSMLAASAEDVLARHQEDAP